MDIHCFPSPLYQGTICSAIICYVLLSAHWCQWTVHNVRLDSVMHSIHIHTRKQATRLFNNDNFLSATPSIWWYPKHNVVNWLLCPSGQALSVHRSSEFRITEISRYCSWTFCRDTSHLRGHFSSLPTVTPLVKWASPHWQQRELHIA